MIAIISDVHSNLEALQAVLDEIGDAEEILCAGDIVGYGPNPNECCGLLRQRGVQCAKGNHDHVCATLEQTERCNSVARRSFVWTHDELTPENREWLESLPLQVNFDGLSMVHGAPGTPEEMLNSYVFDYYYNHRRYQKLLDRVPGRRLVLGHTHIPLSHGFSSKVINPGSVGQPRDGDRRASYATIEDIRYGFPLVPLLKASFRMSNDRVVFHRVEYDVEEPARKIEGESGLSDGAANMLRNGGLLF